MTSKPGSARPKKASRRYVQRLLQEHCLVSRIPDEVAAAVVHLLLKKGFLSETDGHVDLQERPGTTLAFPEDAGRAIRQALLSFESGEGSTYQLAHLLRGSIASGSGAGFGSNTPRVVVSQGWSAGKWERLVWNREDLISAFGKEGQREGRIIVDYLISFRRPKVESEKATRKQRALGLLREDKRDWIPARELDKKFGVPRTSVDKDCLTQRTQGNRRGGGAGQKQVSYRKEYLMEYVEQRWSPRSPRK